MLLVACQASEPPPIPDADRVFVMSAVSAQLLDGESARWRWPQAKPGWLSRADPVYCGWVNAKNSFGAYAGWKRFMIVSAHHQPQLKVVMLDFGGADYEGRYAGLGPSADGFLNIAETCAKYGYPEAVPAA